MTAPSWSKDAIWYQIFPERFRNGCPASNPRLTDITNRDVDGWAITPWGQSWYDQPEWERLLGDFYTSVYYRRYGGDLIGVREKLDYLQDLGVNAIYLNPIFTARSLHKYDSACFHHIDPTFGPDRAGDLVALAQADETEDPDTWIWTSADRYFLDLVADVHARGMHIIIDGVFNHTGREFFAFKDILQRGQRSAYRDWYAIDEWHEDGHVTYKGWAGHPSLPEFARADGNLVESVRTYISDITRRWMRPDGDAASGVDGWRLDVAHCVPAKFWKDWHVLVRALNPDAYTTGEIVTLAQDYLQGDQFDAVMNYMWLYPTTSLFGGTTETVTTATFMERQQALLGAYPAEVHHGLQNLLGSHDVGRVVSMIENAGAELDNWEDYFHASRAKSNAAFVTHRPGESSYTWLRQMIVFQMTYIGAPMLYYGTEVGMWGANDPDNRQPMLWGDAPCEVDRNGQAPRPDTELRQFVSKAIALRAASTSLRRGDLTWISTEREHLLIYDRMFNGDHIRVALNVSSESEPIVIEVCARDMWTEEFVSAGELTVPPQGWRILAFEREEGA